MGSLWRLLWDLAPEVEEKWSCGKNTKLANRLFGFKSWLYVFLALRLLKVFDILMKWKEYNNSCPILDSLQYEIIAILTITVLSLEWPLPPFHNLTQLASLVKTFLTTLYQRNLPQSTFTLYYYIAYAISACMCIAYYNQTSWFIYYSTDFKKLFKCFHRNMCTYTPQIQILLWKLGIAHLVPIAKIQCHQGKEAYLRIWNSSISLKGP